MVMTCVKDLSRCGESLEYAEILLALCRLPPAGWDFLPWTSIQRSWIEPISISDVSSSPKGGLKLFEGECLVLTLSLFDTGKGMLNWVVHHFTMRRGGFYWYIWRGWQWWSTSWGDINRICNNHCGYSRRVLLLTLITQAELRTNVPQGLEELTPEITGTGPVDLSLFH